MSGPEKCAQLSLDLGRGDFPRGVIHRKTAEAPNGAGDQQSAGFGVLFQCVDLAVGGGQGAHGRLSDVVRSNTTERYVEGDRSAVGPDHGNTSHALEIPPQLSVMGENKNPLRNQHGEDDQRDLPDGTFQSPRLTRSTR